MSFGLFVMTTGKRIEIQKKKEEFPYLETEGTRLLPQPLTHQQSQTPKPLLLVLGLCHPLPQKTAQKEWKSHALPSRNISPNVAAEHAEKASANQSRAFDATDDMQSQVETSGHETMIETQSQRSVFLVLDVWFGKSRVSWIFSA
jgi:glycerol-3-phosphate O-acyltransferase